MPGQTYNSMAMRGKNGGSDDHPRHNGDSAPVIGRNISYLLDACHYAFD